MRRLPVWLYEDEVSDKADYITGTTVLSLAGARDYVAYREAQMSRQSDQTCRVLRLIGV